MTTNQTAPVTDEELDQMIWKLERDGMTPKQLSLMRELRELRRAKAPTAPDEQSFWDWLRDEMPTTYRWSRELEDTPENSALITKGKASALDMLSAWKGCSAAMQLSGNSEQLEPVSNRDELPAMQFKPVSDLYGITSPTGSETSFTFDANEAANFINGGWSVQEYVELERYQEAMIGNFRENVNSSTRYFREISETSTNEHVRREYRASDEQVVLREYRTNHSVWIQCSKQAYESRKAEGCEVRELYERPQAGNSPATPDGWIPVSERMPENATGVLVASPWQCAPGGYAMKWATLCPGHPDADSEGWIIPGASWSPTHWHTLPAAPKEVG